MCKPECTALLLILIAATSVERINKTLGLSGSLLRQKNALLTAWKTVLIKYDFPQLLLPERNRWNGDDCFEIVPDLTLTCHKPQLYIKSNICLCLKFRNLVSLLILLSLKMVVWSSEDIFSE